MKKLFHLLAVVVLLTTAISFQSCSDDKYTVWTDTGTYEEFQTAFQAELEIGYYKRLEITSDQWAEISKELTSEGRHRWSEAEIKKWLVGNGFGEYEATKESSWLAMVNHGFLVTRDQNFVYMILK